MTTVAGTIKQTAGDVTSLSEKNPLLKYGVGGLGSAAGYWIFIKIWNWVAEKYPNMVVSTYAKPIAKTVVAVVMYMLSRYPKISKIPFAESFFTGAGIGIFGSMVVDFVVAKFPSINSGSSAAKAATATLSSESAGFRNVALFSGGV